MIIILSWLLIPLIEWLGSTFIGPYSRSLFTEDNWFLYIVDTILTLLSIIVVPFCSREIKKIHYTPRIYSYILIIGLVCSILWLYFRFNGEWIFFGPFQNIISFIDIWIIVLWCISIFIIAQIYSIRKDNTEIVQDEINTFIPDTPIENSDDDALNRTRIAASLAKKIRNLQKIKGAHSIAITAPWGNGKTSFLNLMKNELKGHNIEIIDIAPWHISPQMSITTHFFNELTKRFNKIDSAVSKFLSDYLDLLDSIKLNWISKFTSIPELSELSERISSKLEQLNKLVVIVFDDLDRLNAPEIEEVFRIIRGSGNFTNFIFISAFDKRYIQEALNHSNPAINEQYIEKFFESEYPLPEFTPCRLCEIILSKCAWLEEKDKEEFKKYINTTDLLFSDGEMVFHLLPNLRSIYRWLNAIKQKYSILKGECIIVDLANLEMLNILFPNVYNLLAKEYDRYLECEQYQSRFKLWEESMRADSKTDFIRSLQQKRKLNLMEICKSELKMSTRDLLDLKEILDRLFPKYGSHREINSISNPNYTKRYFDGILDKSEISTQQFSDLISGDEDYKSFIDSDAEYEEYRNSLFLHCYYANPTNNTEIKRLLEIIFYAAQNYKNFKFPPRDIIIHLNRFSTSQEEQKALLKHLILENGFSLFVVFTLSPINGDDNSGFCDLLSRDERDEIIAIMLKEAINCNASFNSVTEIFGYSRTLEFEYVEDQKQRKVYRAKNVYANKIFKQFVASNFIDNMSSLIWSDHRTKEFYPSTDFTEMWNTWEDFKNYQSELGISYTSELNQQRINEFERFYKQWKSNNEKPVSFIFTYIPK